MILGLIAGVLVVFSVVFLDRLKIDDPVGAVIVHAVNGVWGTLAAALFDTTGKASVTVQLIGIVAAFVWTFGLMYLFFKFLAATMGLRVSPEEEIEGLDTQEHGNEAYAADAYAPLAGEASV